MKAQIQLLNRAKHLYSDKYFISDSVDFRFNQMYLKIEGVWIECDESTRSINLSDIIDSEGNKIFASLSEDGKGGDTYSIQDEYNPMGSNKIIYRNTTFVFIIDEGSFAVRVVKRDSTFEDKDTSSIGNYHVGMILAGHRKEDLKVTGIQS